ncbi:hypothetical protein [Clostridium coskatii]|uniref:Phage minor structural protein GP20 n=1 Tax=Clostridium coskatii TaxID=1705578 RepID=A0A168R7H7_9CLOT|nr:hypothetical protein [Clostridium coskatii]OAA90150.1 hypothetical protein WX73_02114 [Clostridium coskatii]OBR91072.1 hypothetical protein CLCOS_36500 [Clostridium coskatii]
MKLDKENYSLQEVQEILKEYDTKMAEFETRIKEADAQAKDMDNQTKQLETLTKSNLENSIKVEMLKNGLSEDMFDLVADSKDVDTASKKINKILDIKKKSDINNSYKPSEHTAEQTAYAEAQKNGDVGAMLRTKMSKLFK